jgi:hypothetical protein
MLDPYTSLSSRKRLSTPHRVREVLDRGANMVYWPDVIIMAAAWGPEWCAGP